VSAKKKTKNEGGGEKVIRSFYDHRATKKRMERAEKEVVNRLEEEKEKKVLEKSMNPGRR